MPPKRKASTTTDDVQPAPKRSLRSNKSDDYELVALPPPKPRRSKRATATDDAATDVDPKPQDVPVASRTRRAAPHSALDDAVSTKPHPGPSRPRVTRKKKPITTNRRGNHAIMEEDDEEEPDELLLSPSKRPVVRPTTPPRLGIPKPTTTPRLVMDCVEIRTPGLRTANGSPTAGRLGNTKTAPSRSSTPSPIKRIGPPRSPSKLQAAPAEPIEPPPGSAPLAGPSSHPPFPPSTPKKYKAHTRSPTASPSKPRPKDVQTSPSRRPKGLDPHFYPCLFAQQRAILRALHDVPDIEQENSRDDEEEPTNVVALEELSSLLLGTVLRGEGNSCLLIGPRGSGKTRVVEKAIAALPERPIIVRLSGHAQQNDRLAIREIARQLTQQTGTSFLPADEEKAAEEGMDDPENPFLDNQEAPDASSTIALPPPAHLLALISMIPTLPRPTIVVLDAFDQFASHARQSLLYCLLDTVQSCRVGKANKGIAVIGVTARIDTINLLEKRVKSRFSGRMLRTACPRRLEDWESLARTILTVPSGAHNRDDEWDTLWAASVDDFLRHPQVKEGLRDTFGLTRDVYTLRRILAHVVLGLSEEAPFLSPATFTASISTQRCLTRFPFLSALPYPSICLLIAAMHARAAGHESFTFEMLHEAFRDQVRTSQSAPVQVEGGSIGMVRCSREVLMGAFERLAAQKVFLATAPPSASVAKEFVPHRCAVDRAEVKKAVETMGQTNLKKWLNKMQ